MPPFPHRFRRQADFTGDLLAGLALQHPLQQQHHILWRQLAVGKQGAAVEVVNPIAAQAAIDRQSASAIYAEEARFVTSRLAVRTLHSLRVEVLFNPSGTRICIEEVYDWKVHADDDSAFALLLLLSQH